MALTPEEALVGTRVRVIGAPERQGSIRRPPTETDCEWWVKIAFDDGGVRLSRLDQIEAIPRNLDAIGEVVAGNFHGPESLRRNLLHEKLNGRLSDVMYSMDTSDTRFHAYQFKPVIKLLESPTNSLLIADEVGLGKTIEAGLIWTELKAREGARTLLVVCPPHLATKWGRELKRRFGVDARKVGAGELLEHLKEASLNRSAGFALIATYHGLRPPKDWEREASGPAAQLARQLAEWHVAAEPFLDLLVMDEAAIMRNDSSQTSELGELLSPIAAHKVYLSATPLHTKARNLFTLLRRLDPETFPDEQTFAGILTANEPLVALRDAILRGNESRDSLLQRIRTAMGSHLLENNHTLRELHERIRAEPDLLDPKVRALLAYQSERVNLLSYVVSRTRRRDIDSDPVLREVNTVKVTLNPNEERFYNLVTDAVLDYSEEQGVSAGFLTVMPQRQVASCVAAACQRFSGGGEADDELSPDTTWDRQTACVGPLVRFIQERIAGKANAADLRANDSKYHRLLESLRQHWALHPDNKVVLFAYFKPTLHYLRERLIEDGVESILLTGDEVRDKQEIVDQFASSKTASILLSSEVGSEGLDLQFASALVNYDLPWNPMIVEQRIGRIHRIGQKAQQIVVINLICEDTVDARIYDRLYRRLDLFRRTLGDLESVIGPLINDLNQELLSLRLSPANQVERIEQTAVAIEAKMQQEELLEQQASVLTAYGDYVLNQITAAHDRGSWIRGDDLEAYVLHFFRRFYPSTRIQGLGQAEGLFEIELDAAAVLEFDDFLSLKNLRGQTRLSNRERQRIRFDHRVYMVAGPAVEVIHQSHPLIRFIGHHLRRNQLVPPIAAAIEVPNHLRPSRTASGVYAFVVQRWTVEGIRAQERLFHTVFHLDSNSRVDDQAAAASIVEVAASLGMECTETPTQQADFLSVLSDRVQELELEAEDAFKRFLRQATQENLDRQQIQIRGVDQFEARRRSSLQQARDNHSTNQRRSLVAAFEGKLEKLRKKCELQREKILRSQTSGECATIGAGLILIH